ncbi:MAG TPA: response regulator transcription factor [Chloroflexota bacterium]|nr:response regulator transcription factor [Chloroflexota bacterium]
MRHEQPVVLVVEDDPIQSDLLREILEADGYRIESVADGAAALDRIAAGHIDLILLDVGLPRVDGVAVCQTIRAPDRSAQPPIIMLSALADDALHETVAIAGANAYLAKPFDIDELLAVVARYCA